MWWLDESANTGTAVLTGEIIAAIAIVNGIWMVTRRAAHRVTDQAKAEKAAGVESAGQLANPS